MFMPKINMVRHHFMELLDDNESVEVIRELIKLQEQIAFMLKTTLVCTPLHGAAGIQ